MRSCASAIVAGVAGLLLMVVSTATAEAQSAQALYAWALEREAEVREALELAPQLRSEPPGAASTELLHQVRLTVVRFEQIVRRFPRSGYSDNALWQGAMLAADAYWQFGDSRDKATALRLFEWLDTEYPSSSLIAGLAGPTTRLNAAAPASGPATLTSIRREVLPDALRITLELEREAVFYEERLDEPARVYVDLQDTDATAPLQNATIPFPTDVVRQARIGRQSNGRTRVVFDLEGADRYSVYSLYNPYRVVIDFERSDEAAREAAVLRASAVTPPAPAAANATGGFSLSRQLGLGVARIVIDPGHGGHDPGARVSGLEEADLVLDIALRLEKLLLTEPGVEVVLTRRLDQYIPLEERTALANRSHADLFLSIHANASRNASARGIETYFLNFAPNPEAEALAARENAGSAQTMGNLPDIVKAIALNNKIDESRDFAGMVQSSMYDRLRKVNQNARNLGVKQAPFVVLIGATMPSVLAEISFLTNRQEAGLLKTQSYRQQIAEALFQGVMSYQQSLKTGTEIATQ